MDSAAIRQVVAKADIQIEHGMPLMPSVAHDLMDIALAYADLLDGLTNGAFLVEPEDGFWPTWACDALTELFKERGIYPKSGPRRLGFVGAEEVLDRLEAVFRARKERK